MPVGGGLFQIDMTGMGPDWSYYTTRATTFADEGDCFRLDPSVKGQYLLPTHHSASTTGFELQLPWPEAENTAHLDVPDDLA